MPRFSITVVVTKQTTTTKTITAESHSDAVDKASKRYDKKPEYRGNGDYTQSKVTTVREIKNY